MIIGHGIDLQTISAVQRAFERNSRFAQKVLTKREFAIFSQLKAKRQLEYLAGRWAAKEAFAKAYGSGIGKLRFLDLEILSNSKGAPVFTCSPFEGNIFVSISHSGDFVEASVILEEKL
ncbi:holo-ACP synthase [Streptococcus macacae]|uniref:Holo-[acyl-carrier-protein] synthase n=1 Tax=Streptococcus macacae NCTC 11558 TaxID=764298 RepID=G5JXD7_9STRE|nr:holo-ACP synthase [Streptococcus macacae]EHJ51687.1 holo-[acyl-carrier-protein] synthase [Streptococcus macacae NCTC 11558]SUN79189.1 4'-phosphopantetheinyl transferase [Streptococcus macacae NCTC 11558]